MFCQHWRCQLYCSSRTIYIYFPCIKGRYEDLFTREKSYFPRATPEGNMTISRVNKFSYLPYAREKNVLFHQANVLVNSEQFLSNFPLDFVILVLYSKATEIINLLFHKKLTKTLNCGCSTLFCIKIESLFNKSFSISLSSAK